MSVIGYIRVSSTKQTVEHQKYEIEQFAKQNKIHLDKWVMETISSRQPLQKRKLGLLLDDLNDNDILISCEISRLGRSLLEVMRILEKCLNKNCQVWTIKENYRLGNDIQSKVMAFACLTRSSFGSSHQYCLHHILRFNVEQLRKAALFLSCHWYFRN